MPKFCAYCGSQLNGYEKFCTNCGSKINKDEPDDKQTVAEPIESIPESTEKISAEPIESIPESTEKISAEPTEPTAENTVKASSEPSFYDEIAQFAEASISNKNIYHTETPELEDTADMDDSETGKKTGTALVLGIMGIVCAFFIDWYGHICSITGIVFGLKEYKATKKKAGLVLSIIGEVMSLISSIIGFIIGFNIGYNIGFNSAFF